METCEYYRLLGEFLARAGVPLRQSGLGPGSRQPPCLTYSAARPAFGGEALLVADAWFGGTAAAMQKDAFLNEMDQLIPQQGARLTGQGGVIIIRREEKDFLQTDESGAPVLHVRLRAAVRLYG